MKTNLTSFYISLTGDTVKFLFRFKWLVKRGLGRPLFLLFPPLEAYIINLIGIITSSIVVYYFTQYLRLDVWLESKYPAQIEKVKKALRKKELPIIAGWSFFPVVPTYLIIYVSSTLNIPFGRTNLK